MGKIVFYSLMIGVNIGGMIFNTSLTDLPLSENYGLMANAVAFVTFSLLLWATPK